MLNTITIRILVIYLYLSVGAATIFNGTIAFLRVDEYGPCLRERGDTYCFVSARLFGDASNPLYNSLVEHSANNVTHFNRTNVHRGICLKASCQNYSSSNKMEAVETCVNASVSRDYGLTAKVFRASCTEYGEGAQFDTSDYAFGAVVLVLLALNIVGSLYEFYGGIGQDTLVGKGLLCFAIRRNWRRLVAPASRDPDQQLLQCLSAYRMFFKFWVVFVHIAIPFVLLVRNIQYIEQLYSYAAAHLVYNAGLIVQGFLVISAFLLAYNVLVAERKQPISGWRNLLFAIFARWLRFTPLYALVVFFTATWMRHMGEGPFWKVVVGEETSDCRRDWMLHLLYIQNYFDIDSLCMLHSWFLAVELQVTIVGAAIFFLLKSTKARQAAIAFVVTVGLVAPGVTAFIHDLDAGTLVTPEVALRRYVDAPWFNKLYKRGHTNLLCYGLGLALAYLIINLDKSDLGAKKYKKYRVVFWLLTPVTLALVASGGLFYGDGARAPLLVRALYASGVKLLFGLIMCFNIFVSIVKVDATLTRVFEWNGWTVLRRLTYCVYLVHMSVISLLAGNSATTVHASQGEMWKTFALVGSASFVIAVALFVAVEAPCAQLAGILLQRLEKKHAD